MPPALQEDAKMANKNKVQRTMRKVDSYLDALTYKKLISMRTDELYANLFHDIAGIVVQEYEDIDVTANTELSVSTVSGANGIKIEITGYIKVGPGCYLQIDKTYLPEGWKEEDYENQ